MKRKITAFAATLTLSGVVFGSSFAQAASYEVEQGDTLSEIAQAHRISIEKLYELNSLSSDLIFPNQVLQVDSTNEDKQETKVEKQTNSNKYKVVEGDSLWKIANKYNVSIANLKQWNQLSSDTIHPGNVFVVNGPAQTTTSEPVKQEAEQSVQKKEEPVKQEQPAQKPVQKQPVKQEQQTQSTQEESGKELTVEATAYTAFCNGCSGVTAAGIDLRANPNQKVIAVDPSVIPLGTKVYVEGYGEAVAGDTGGAIKGNKIDVFMPEKSDALNWGRKTVKIKVLN